MTDLQFKAFLREHMADLECVRAAGVTRTLFGLGCIGWAEVSEWE